ncbi:MAG: hypothetical protein JJU48_08675, partial [Methylophaga sp.]|nr:hypothetical protein [Methylophaga sp.]
MTVFVYVCVIPSENLRHPELVEGSQRIFSVSEEACRKWFRDASAVVGMTVFVYVCVIPSENLRHPELVEGSQSIF